ncbi:Uncharacterized protein Adt_33990 [Abeliophyllum distichum]|uniref:Uncharacterized protein n=1 Tax=Abeliophyllum distichum TaxID=126358 RepID=A0ABD1QXT9_9LAMI
MANKGDFNAILNRDERIGDNSPNSRSMEDFNSMLMACGVEKVNCDCQYTWSNVRMWEKLDRILVNYQWISAFDGFKAEVLNRDTSDHFPILLKCSPSNSKKMSSFRFQSMWCQHENLLEVFGNIFDGIRKAENEALDKEKLYDALQNSEAIEEVHKAYANLNRLLSQEEDYWRQKSRG